MMTGRCGLRLAAAMFVLGVVLAGAAAQAAEVTVWYVSEDLVLNVEVQDGSGIVKREKIPLTNDEAGNLCYIVYLPPGTRFTVPPGWTIEALRAASQSAEGVGTPAGGGENVRFTEGDAVLFSSAGEDIRLTARYADLPMPAVPLPRIERQPRNQNIRTGETAIFEVTASGTAPLFYQWQAYDRGVWWNITGAESRTLRVWRARISDNGARYRVIVTNEGGSVASSAAYLGVSTGYDDDTWDDYGYGTGCNAGTFPLLALIALLALRRR